MLKRYRWLIVSMLFLASTINYVDRAAFSVAAPFFASTFHLDAFQIGVCFSAFSVGYTAFNFVGGYLADRFGPRRTFAGAMAAWSVFCGLTAAASGFGTLLAVRLLFGCGEGPLGSTANKTIGNWVPPRQRARALGIAFSGNTLGGVLAGPLVGAIAAAFDWRTAFVVLAVVGLIWAVAWMRLATDTPERHPKVGALERAEMAALDTGADALPRASVPLLRLLRQPAVACTALAYFGFSYVLYFFLSWFPSYLAAAHGMSLREMSAVSAIPWVAGTLGLVLGGALSDGLYRHIGRLLPARKIPLIAGLAVAAFSVGGAGMARTPAGAVALMSVGVFFMYLTATSYWLIIVDSVPRRSLGRVTGAFHAVANLSGIVAPALTGCIVQATGKFDAAFYLAGAVALIAAIGIAPFIRRIDSEIGNENPMPN